MIDVVTITGPILEPVTASEAKQNSNILFDGDDSLVASLISAARQVVEQRSGIRLYTQTIEFRADSFADIGLTEPARSDVINLRVGNIASVDTVKYYDGDDADTTMSASDYWTDVTGYPARVQVKSSWPSTNDRIGNIRIRCTAGWTSVDSVPENLKQAIKLLVSHYYENREATTDLKLMEIPEGVDALILGSEYHHFKTGSI